MGKVMLWQDNLCLLGVIYTIGYRELDKMAV